MAADHFCLRWNNYQSNMVSELDSLRSDEDLVDVTLSCGGQLLKAHKVILSACSPYFRSVFKENPCKHPVVILKDVSYEDVESLLSFVYQGVVYISEKKLASFLQTAELLQIRGLTSTATNIKEDVNKSTTEKSNISRPPQLLTPIPVNNWKQHQQISTNSAGAMPTSISCSPTRKLSVSNPSSPSPILSKRRKTLPTRLIPSTDISEFSDTTSIQDCSELENDLQKIKPEMLNNESSVEEDCQSVDENSRDSTKEGNSEDTEDDDLEIQGEDVQYSISLQATHQKEGSGNGKVSAPNIFNAMTQNYATGNIVEQTISSCPDPRLGRRPCPLCQKIISNKSNLLKHMRIRHSDEYNPAGCTACGKVFKNKYSLRAHINIYHKDLTQFNFQISNAYCTNNAVVNNMTSSCFNNTSNSNEAAAFASSLINSFNNHNNFMMQNSQEYSMKNNSNDLPLLPFEISNRHSLM